MDAARLEAHLRGRLPALRGKLSLGADMAKITWFRTGGPAELLFQPADEADLAAFLAELPEDVPLTVVGIGSNLLVRDGGIDGVVVKLPPKGFGEASPIGGNRLRVGAGVSDKRVSALALEEGLAGFHFLAGIPGSIGGALRMNAGANGVETAERFVEAVALDRKGRRHVLSPADMGFSYRHTEVPDDFIFVSAVLEGEAGTRDAIAASIEEVRHHRETVQPVREKTGGSTFRNPQGTSAWKEVERAGCRGFAVGGARMSEMHCNFMINEADASAHDLELLGETVRERVFRASGILLHWEIARLGRFEAGREVSPFVP